MQMKCVSQQDKVLWAPQSSKIWVPFLFLLHDITICLCLIVQHGYLSSREHIYIPASSMEERGRGMLLSPKNMFFLYLIHSPFTSFSIHAPHFSSPLAGWSIPLHSPLIHPSRISL